MGARFQWTVAGYGMVAWGYGTVRLQWTVAGLRGPAYDGRYGRRVHLRSELVDEQGAPTRVSAEADCLLRSYPRVLFLVYGHGGWRVMGCRRGGTDGRRSRHLVKVDVWELGWVGGLRKHLGALCYAVAGREHNGESSVVARVLLAGADLFVPLCATIAPSFIPR